MGSLYKVFGSGIWGRNLAKTSTNSVFPKEEGGKPNALFLSLEIEGKP